MRTLFSILLIFLNTNFLIQKPLFAKEFQNNEQTKFYSGINEDLYLLGPGDLLEIVLFDDKELSGQYQISNSGEVNLPLVGLVNLDNLSIKQASEKLVNKFENELLRPDLYLKVLVPRPIKVSVVGEVQNPGLYSLSKKERFNVDGKIILNDGLPTVVDAIQKSGGITQSADLEGVVIRRRLPGPEKKYKQAKLNLIDLIKKGDQTQNPLLFDGDVIVINEGLVIGSSILENSNSNLSPSNISVYIVGKVNNPKMYNIKANTPLIQALYQAGGPQRFVSNLSNVELIRVNKNGTITKKNIKVDTRKPLSTKNNPPLKNGDVVRVKSNKFNDVTGGLAQITQPLSGLINAVTLYKLFD